MLPLAVIKPLYCLPERLAMCVARRFDLGGVQLFTFLLGRNRADDLRRKATAALALIETNSPKLHTRVRRFVPKILIFGAHVYNAVYIADLKLCDLSIEYALADTTTPSRLAMTLVHEATHGYLQSGGLLYEEHRRERMEHICMRTELALARKLPQSGELISEVEAKLSIPSDYWKREAFAQRNVDYFKHIGAPRWVISCLERKKAKLAQPDGAANRSQSVRADTNEAPGAAGSSR
jgi:hypothetical protein